VAIVVSARAQEPEPPREVAEFEAEATSAAPDRLPPHVARGVAYLIAVQNADGGWGMSRSDPATTAFVCLALVRAGSTTTTGPHYDAVQRGTEWLISRVEQFPDSYLDQVSSSNTQPHRKLGPLTDTSLTMQYLARILPTVPSKPSPSEAVLRSRVDASLDKCLTRLKLLQAPDGSWKSGGGGWAGLPLQTALCCSALEMAQVVGKSVASEMLTRVRRYFLGSGGFELGPGRGLYSYASAQRSMAALARAAMDAIRDAQRENRVSDYALPTEGNLVQAGVPSELVAAMARAYRQSKLQSQRLDDQQLMSGFGTIGGEELLSYLLIREWLLILDEHRPWNERIDYKLASLQNSNGSWTGLHCITSPIFCTAAVVNYYTADRDAPTWTAVADAVLHPVDATSAYRSPSNGTQPEIDPEIEAFFFDTGPARQTKRRRRR
jgi:hypothetical protein